MRAFSALLCALAALACARRGPAPAAQPQSILLVTIDTLRADRVGAYGDVEARTPALDRLAAGGTLFERAYSPVPITLPAHASLFTGLLPPAHGVRGNGTFSLRDGPTTLAEALKARGLRTAAFVGGFPVSGRFGLARGFDHYDDDVEKAPGVHYGLAERRAGAVVAAAREWLAAHTGRVFVWVHFFDPHAPYDPPEAFRGPDAYRGEVASADAALADLLSAWEARPGPALVAVTSDHGEAFGEHREQSHSLFVYDTTLRVPLVLRGPGVPAGLRVPAPVGIADVAATLVRRIGATGPMPAGRDLLDDAGPSARSTPLYAETLAPRLDFGWGELRAWRDGRYKYIRAPRPELYDVVADPGETTDLFAARAEVARQLARDLDAALAGMDDRESRRADPEAEERLRALGYVQGPGGAGSGADPKDNVELALDIARATGPFGSHAEAVGVYTALAARDPENPLLNFRLADALLRSGRPREAVAHFQKVVASGPRSADPFVGLATAFAQTNRLEQARETLERALDLDPRNGQVHYNLGEIARSRGDLSAARAAYRAALADPVTRDRASARLDSIQ